MARYDDINAGAISVIGFISVVISFVLIVAAQVLYFQYQEIETRHKREQFPLNESETKLAQQKTVLESYTWIDREKGIVSRPIKQSMQSVLDNMKSDKSK